MRCAGLLLTGGQSRRLGEDKAALRLRPGTATLAERAADALASVTAPTLEVGPGWSNLPVVAEGHEPRGPLVALVHGAGAVDDRAAVLVLACDMPLVTAGLLRWLADRPGRRTVVPLAGDPPAPQPLCARWTHEDLVRAGALVEAGERSLKALLAASAVTYVEPHEWQIHAGTAGAHAFDDVDTPAALARMRDLYPLTEP
ncbi:MAG: molybdenum cofactor guanylyltransferase [Acidimicrobiales bacterium]